MAIALKNRRVVTVAPETTRGTFLAPNATNDALPMIRECTFTIEPVVVERPTLRLSLTPYPKIYPGVAKARISLLMELHGIPPNPQANFAAPVWADLMRACGFFEVSNAGSTIAFGGGYAPIVSNPRIYTGFTGMTGSNGSPMRHGESITADYASGSDITGFVVGDTFFDDDMILINEVATTPGTGAITLTTAAGGSNKSTNAGTVTRDTDKVVAFIQRSTVNLMETVSMEVYLDGKRLQARGMMGTVEVVATHGDAIKARFEMTGIEHTYADAAMPGTPNEQHYVPPTFLNKDLRCSYFDGSNTRVYGKDTAGSNSLGAVNAFSIAAGNGVILRENSFDAAGFSFALITSRAGTGRFNPDEVLSGTPDNFDFISRFVAGQTFRMRGFFGSRQGDGGGAFPTDGNSIDIIAPGIVFSGMADQDRDGINVWDAQYSLTGGDYDATASGELPGNDNEFTLIYR